MSMDEIERRRFLGGRKRQVICITIPTTYPDGRQKPFAFVRLVEPNERLHPVASSKSSSSTLR